MKKIYTKDPHTGVVINLHHIILNFGKVEIRLNNRVAFELKNNIWNEFFLQP